MPKKRKYPKSNYGRKKEFLVRLGRGLKRRVWGWEFQKHKPWKTGKIGR